MRYFLVRQERNTAGRYDTNQRGKQTFVKAQQRLVSVNNNQ